MAKPKVILVAVPGVTEYEFLPGSVGAYAGVPRPTPGIVDIVDMGKLHMSTMFDGLQS